MSSSLWSVAREIVTPPTLTGSRIAHGLSGSGTTDADRDLEQLRLGGHRRPLVRAGPARPLVQCSKPLLLLERVDLDHDPVDLVVELGAPPLPLGAGPGDVLDRLEPLREGIRPEAALAQPRERLEVRVRRDALAVAGAVDPDGERACCGDPGVELPQRPRGGVARVRCRGLPGGDLLLVEAAEAGERKVDLAAHLHQRWRVPLQREWDRADRAQVDGHILAAEAVTTSRAAQQSAVLVDERDRRAVDLRLDHVRHRLVGVEALPHVVGPLEQALVRRHLLERAHRREVLDLRELVGGGCTDPAGRRVVAGELGMLLLESFQLVEQPVVLGVRHLRVVEDVVAVVVVVQQLAQLGGALDLRGRQEAPRRCRRPRPALPPRAAHAGGCDPR